MMTLIQDTTAQGSNESQLSLEGIQAIVDTRDDSTDFYTSVERCNKFRIRAYLLEGLTAILLEFWYCDGPLHFLDGVMELAQAHLNLVVLCGQPRLPAALISVADTSFAVFELNHDFGALERSIESYKRLLEVNSHISLTSHQRTYVAARLVYALGSRFRVTNEKHDCEAAKQIFDTIQAANDDTIGHAWTCIAIGFLRSTPYAWRYISVSSEDLKSAHCNLKTLRNSPLPHSLYALSIIAESRLASVIYNKTHQDEHLLLDTIQPLQSVLQSRSGTSSILRYNTISALSHAHLNARHFAKDRQHASTHFDNAVVLAEEARSLGDFMDRNVYEKWLSHYRWVQPTMQRALVDQDLDAMEQAVDTMKEVFRKRQDSQSGALWHAHMLNHLVYIMGTYFEHTGRVSVLDELMTLSKDHMYTDVLSIPFFASNMAELMLHRAHISGVQQSTSLIHDAFELCQARKASPGFAEINSRERTSVDLQIIAACRMQMRAGDRPFMDAKRIIELAQQNFVQTPSQVTEARAALAIAQVDAMALQARIEKNVAPLIAGVSLIEKELTSPDMIASIHRTDLLAARVDLLLHHSALDNMDVSGQLLLNAWSEYKVAAKATLARPRERFQACLRWGNWAAERQQKDMAFEAYSLSIDILPQVVFLGEEIVGRIEALRQVNGLAASSAVIALTTGNIPMAVEFLERTRGILWLQSFRSRDIELLVLPTNLQSRISSLGRELEDADRLHWTIRRHKTEVYGRLVAQVRTFPGLDRFQLPPLLKDVHQRLQKSQGYAVVIIPSTLHCDVIILGAPISPCHLRLPTPTVEHIRFLSGNFSKSCSITRAAHHHIETARKVAQIHLQSKANRDTEAIMLVLTELWTDLIRPIIKHISLSRSGDPDGRKRVWWCPTGPLSSLPLHAAGVYQGPSADQISNYVISSYTPTITALHHLLNARPVPQPESVTHKMLLIGQSTSIGSLPLVNVGIELDHVKDLAPPRYVTNSQVQQTMKVSEALAELKDAKMLHLACHGQQDQDNPLNSGFDLTDGRLSLGQLMRVNNPDAQLAYLSACDSAGMDESRPDEGLNLVGAMIFVGFRSVIGTMWTMDDIDGPFMARCIYTRIFKDGYLNLDAVPYAVDDAVRRLRETGAPASRWATYVHFGA